MDAYILAGGEGTRLRSRLSKGEPKAMAMVAGRPFIEYPLDLLCESRRASRIILCVRYGWEEIYRHVGGAYRGVPVLYHVEPRPCGTGGALASAFRASPKHSLCLALNGDCLWKADIGKYVDAFVDSGADVGMALAQVPDASRFGTVRLDEKNGRVLRFVEKTPGAGTINVGAYILPQDVFERYGSHLPESFSLEKKIFEPMPFSIFPYVITGRFVDIGVPDDYDAAQRFDT
ncbi:MAG: sugar phosphate nucleotidyltransferase [Rickettsiales bacterium]